MKKSSTESVVVDITGAAAYLQISREKMYQLVWDGEVKHMRIGRAIRIRRTDLDDFISSVMKIGA